jgi:DNA-binding NarL/FixJ family response regulator
VAILDACLPLPSTEVLVADILSVSPAARVLAISEEMTHAGAFPLLRLGVKAILTYVDARRQLVPAIAAVALGAVWVPRDILSAFLDGVLARGPTRCMPSGPGLSRREQEVLGTVLENLSNKEIAGRLNISERTVKFHVSNLLGKFSVQRRADLILLSFQSGAHAQRPSLAYRDERRPAPTRDQEWDPAPGVSGGGS